MITPSATIWTISALNFEIRTMLEKGIGAIWIEGELSNLAQPASGHWYFSLKDDNAQLRAAMFKNRNRRVGFTPQNGQQVLLRATPTVYEARGDYQVIVEHMEQAGTGLLMRQYEQLKQKLTAEGLFDAQYKQRVPAQAQHIGLITSPTGAAVRDAISVIRRRSPISRVTLFPTQVQGEQAATAIVDAIHAANRFAQCDVLLLIRGGGSLEDLWCFNDERVARAVFDSDCPVVSGVGHEIDYTIVDFVADHRAPTPSVAAETVTLDQYEIMSSLDRLQASLLRALQHRLRQPIDRLRNLVNRINTLHPQRRLQALSQRLQYSWSRLVLGQQTRIRDSRAHLMLTTEQLRSHSPRNKVAAAHTRLDHLHHQLTIGIRQQLVRQRHRLSLQASALDKLSPLKTLSRGYAVVSKEHQVVTSTEQLDSGDAISIRLRDGDKAARIE